MQRIHVLGRNDLSKLSGSTSHVVVRDFERDPEYLRFFRLRSEKGDEVYYIAEGKLSEKKINSLVRDAGITSVVLFSSTLGRVETLKLLSILNDAGLKCIIVLSEKETKSDYLYYIGNTSQNVFLAFPVISSNTGDGWGRFKLIHDLVYDKSWNLSRNYYMYEMENPAELSAYSKAFMLRIFSSFIGVISKRCYIDSMLGITYSPHVGLYCGAVNSLDFKDVKYNHTQQYSLFLLNDESIRDFIGGKLGIGLYSIFQKKLER